MRLLPLALLSLACSAPAQTTPTPQFEVASVKPSPPPARPPDGIPRSQGGPGSHDPEQKEFYQAATLRFPRFF